MSERIVEFEEYSSDDVTIGSYDDAVEVLADLAEISAEIAPRYAVLKFIYHDEA